jgi:hypothetical protein
VSASQLVADAVAVSGLSARQFAFGILGVDERTVRRWLAGDRDVPGTVRVVCQAIIDDPTIVYALAKASAVVDERFGIVDD